MLASRRVWCESPRHRVVVRVALSFVCICLPSKECHAVPARSGASRLPPRGPRDPGWPPGRNAGLT